MSEKIIGYLLLFTGILAMIGSALGVYFVFSGRYDTYQLFNLPAITLDLSGLMQAENPDMVLPTEANLETELVKSDVLNKPLNLIAHILFMGFLVNVGFKIATLGVQMIRPIKVNLKGEKSILLPNSN
jgi:hypothetical protein